MSLNWQLSSLIQCPSSTISSASPTLSLPTPWWTLKPRAFSTIHHLTRVSGSLQCFLQSVFLLPSLCPLMDNSPGFLYSVLSHTGYLWETQSSVLLHKLLHKMCSWSTLVVAEALMTKHHLHYQMSESTHTVEGIGGWISFFVVKSSPFICVLIS